MSLRFSAMRKWAPVVAALAVLTVAAGGVLLARGAGSSPGSDGAATPGSDGWRLVSYRDVVVGVPETWGWGEAPGSDWCAGSQDGFPEEPYVDVSRGSEVTLAIGCNGPVPERYNVTHLEFSEPGTGAEAPDEGADWFLLSRRVGAAVVNVWSDAEHRETAQRIVDSARVVAVDPSGCAVRSPIQAGHFARPEQPFRVEDVTSVDAISVCQYALTGDTDVPGLLASHRMTGAAAREVLAAIQAAPPGGGPDAPQSCSEDSFGDMALTLRLHEGEATQEMYVYMQSCRGNGFDDGTTLRELTAEACRPLWVLPVRMTWGHGRSFARCYG